MDLTANKKKTTAPESSKHLQLVGLSFTGFVVLLRHKSLTNPLPSTTFPNVTTWDDLTKWLYKILPSKDFSYEVRFKVRVSDEEVLESFPGYEMGQEVVVPICSQEEYNTALLLWLSLSSTSGHPKSLQIYATEKSKKRKNPEAGTDSDSSSDDRPSQKRRKLGRGSSKERNSGDGNKAVS
ncbi:hypothetical protein BDD12DRAFT_851418 [Trichophaea hybrida]|nr:hypothetical protein BDD12DRAFT_851418 [Trichophaea hybrida]